ncbi:MAG: hypothetical protein ABR887_05160 [Methanoregulaceae archaeon]|jgi:tRNA (guanine37-N1)-methyltransferase
MGYVLKDVLKEFIPEGLLSHLSNHFEVIGDLAIISIPPQLDNYKTRIAETIITQRKNISTVLNKITKVSGQKRTPLYEILAGTTTVTCHREFGFVYRLDINTTFFSTHLAYERKRIFDQVRVGECVLVPFCGVGPFAIPPAAKGAKVVAIEQNPEAFGWLSKNVSLNRVDKLITIINGDAFDTSILPHHEFVRAIIPTPYGMDTILDVIKPVMIEDGIIHFYTFKKRYQIPELIKEYESKGFEVKFYRSCGNVAPNVSRWVFDLIKRGKPENSQNREISD